MITSKGRLYGDLPLPKGYEGELIANGLRSEGWENLSFSELTDEISAKMDKTDKKGDLTFQYDYRIRCRWKKIGSEKGYTRIYVHVEDREDQSRTNQCEQLCFELLSSIKEAGERASQKLLTMDRSTKYGSDRWAEYADLDQRGLVQKIDEVKGNRLILGPCADVAEDDFVVTIPEEETCRHSIVCGPTGCGKTSSVFIPNIVERANFSAILTEATSGQESPDLYSKTSGHRLKNGHKVYYFNPDDAASIRINPIEHVDSVGKAIDVAALIMQNTQNKFKTGGEQFWQDAERHLLTALVMHVAPEKGHLGDVRSLLRKGPDKLGQALSNSSIAVAKEEYDAFLNIGTENIQKGVMIGLMQRLNNWIDPKVLALTEKTDVDFGTLKDELFTFYLAVPASKDRLKPVASLILNYMIEMVENTEFKHSVNLFLDEFTNFGYIPGLPTKMGIIRHKKVPVMLGCQDFVQIRIEYGDDPTKALFNNIATKVVFRSNDLMTAKVVSESLGQETVVDRKLDTSCNVQQEEFGRPLMRPSEVMSLDQDVSIVFNPVTYPIKMTRFSWRDYVEYTDIEPHKHDPVEVDDRLIKECSKEKSEPTWQKKASEETIEKEAEEYGRKSSKKDGSEAEKQKRKPEQKTERDFDIPL